MAHRFSYQAFLDQDRYIFLQDITYSTYREFVKVLLDNNPVVVNFFIENIIKDCYVKSNFDFDIKRLTIIDKLLILLMIKSYSIGSDVDLEVTCSETGKVFRCNVNCNDVVIALLQSEIINTHSIETGKLCIDMALPTTFEPYTKSNILNHCIKSIKYKNEVISNESLDGLPVTVLSSVNSFIQDQNKLLSNTPVFTYKSPFVKDAPQQKISLSLFDDSFISVIKLFFDADLLDLYETEYLLIKHHNFNEELFQSKTPAEIHAFISIIEKYQAENKQDTNVNVPGMAIPPEFENE